MALKDLDERCCVAMAKLGFALFLLLWGTLALANGDGDARNSYPAAKWAPIHFKPAIDAAEDQQCLACHAEVLKPSTRKHAPAGVDAGTSLAWYQTLDTYRGEQDTLHRRHLSSDYANRVMDLRCNTCHQGHDPRAEAPGSSATAQTGGYNLRKQVDTKTCLMCHGQFNAEVMGLPGPWAQHRDTFGNDCLACHETIRTSRHNVNFLKPAEIEAAGKESGDACYGCHGGRAWYRVSYPYPRHAWPTMDKDVPDWAKQRPTRSDPRFLNGLPTRAEAKPVRSGASTPAAGKPAVTKTTATKPSRRSGDARPRAAKNTDA
jgi:nitrate/TMAO reductase-like tetraheme cytochrome c subunit